MSDKKGIKLITRGRITWGKMTLVKSTSGVHCAESDIISVLLTQRLRSCAEKKLVG